MLGNQYFQRVAVYELIRISEDLYSQLILFFSLQPFILLLAKAFRYLSNVGFFHFGAITFKWPQTGEVKL